MFEQVLVRIWEKLLDLREVGVFDHFFEIGGHSLLAARDRQSDAQLRYSRAMDNYAGGPYAGRIVIIRSRQLDDARPDLGWARLAASAEIHVLPGDHVTLVTRYVGELAKVTREAIDRVLERATP